jgi:hypothetical protein
MKTIDYIFNMNKNIIITIGVFIISLNVGIYCYAPSVPALVAQASMKTNKMTVPLDFEYAANFIDDNILVGASHNIFVGKVIKQVGNKSRGFGPETQFSVEAIFNIKGSLQGAVTVNQEGGYDKNGVLYYVEDGIPLLQSGKTYLLSTRYSTQENWYTVNPFPTANKLISQVATSTDSQLRISAMGDARVRQLQNVYPTEILLGADIRNNNTRNKYQSSSINVFPTDTTTH